MAFNQRVQPFPAPACRMVMTGMVDANRVVGLQPVRAGLDDVVGGGNDVPGGPVVLDQSFQLSAPLLKTWMDSVNTFANRHG
jgi:hypothetical protein